MNKKCAAFVFVGTITCICLNFGQFSPLKTHRINLYTVKAVKVLTLLNDIMVAAKMLTSQVWYQSVTEWVKMAIMCNLLVNWDKLLKTTNPYIITWKSSPICILCNHLVIESGVPEVEDAALSSLQSANAKKVNAIFLCHQEFAILTLCD